MSAFTLHDENDELGARRRDILMDSGDDGSDVVVDIQTERSPRTPLHSMFESARTRLAETRAAAFAASLTRALVVRAAVVTWAVLVFVLVCVCAARARNAPRHSSECATSTSASAAVAAAECMHAMSLDSGAACLRLPAPAGTRCSVAPCHIMPRSSSASSPACDGEGECVTPHCAGECERASDCPVLHLVGSSTPQKALCTWKSCVYTHQTSLPVAASSSCSSASIFRQLCASLLAADDALASCLQVDSLCENSQLLCVYSFRCARPVATPS